MNDHWKSVKLGEIAKFSQGLQVPIGRQETNCSSPDYVRFIRIVDYTEKTKDIRHIQNPGPKYWVNEDNLVVRYGSASMGLIGRGEEGVIANNIFKISPDEDRVLKPYLYFCLQSKAIRQTTWSENASSTMPALTFGIAGDLDIPLLDLPTQRKIAGILSAYDDLIENHLRRIRILEEMAQSLYHEWFVHFRFPGHECTKMVDSPSAPFRRGGR